MSDEHDCSAHFSFSHLSFEGESVLAYGQCTECDKRLIEVYDYSMTVTKQEHEVLNRRE